MIRIFGQTDKLYTSNGDIVIQPFKAKIHKEDNGDYYLDLECGLEYADYITQGRLVVAPDPAGTQAFRIDNPEKLMHKIKARAWHVYYDSENYLISDSYVVDKNCNDALDHLNNATEPASEFTTISDVTSINSFRCVRKSLREVVETVCERWGGHIVRNNFNIAIRQNIGVDNGVTVRYGKNLKDIVVTEDWDKVVTKLMPVGRDGIKLPEVYLIADTSYPIPYTKVVSFEQDINEEDYKNADGTTDTAAYEAALIDDLRLQAQKYIEVNQYPQINYTLKGNLEKITDIGDKVEVIDERLGVDLVTSVISFDYDCILEKYTEVSFGNFKKKLSGYSGAISAGVSTAIKETTETVTATLQDEMTAATSQIWEALSGSNVIYEGDKILVVDRLPKESATYVMMINAAGIGFSNTGINGTFSSAWTIDGTLNMQNINVINLMDDVIYIGSQQLYDRYDFTAAGTVTLLGAYDYRLIDGIFNGFTIPTGYEKAYRLTAQVTTNNGNTVGASIGVMSCSGGTWSGVTFRITISSAIVKQSEFTLEQTFNYTKNGLNLKVTNSGSYTGSIYAITVHGYIVKSSTAFPAVANYIATEEAT